MKFPTGLQKATLVQRYKRFLADIKDESGLISTIHCPNTGSMRHCAEPGFGVWFSESNNKKRKYPYTWELAEDFDQNLIGINSAFANKIVKEGLEQGRVTELAGYDEIQTEVKYGEENSRIDLLLKKEGAPDCYVEVKSVTLNVSGSGYFPDSVSLRGQKHIRELEAIIKSKARSVLFYCVQHTGIESVSPAWDIDIDYANALAQAVAAGVEVLVYGCHITPEEVRLSKRLPFILNR